MQHKRNGRSKGSGQFYALPYHMLKSNQFRRLSGAAVKIWLELHSRFQVKGDGRDSNNGQITLSMTDAARLLGLGKTTVSRAFGELELRGFIAKTKQGQWYGRQASEWRLTDERCNTDQPTNDWRRNGQKSVEERADLGQNDKRQMEKI